MKPKVVVVCGDPGGAAAVAPVIKELERDGRVEVMPFAYNEANEVWKGMGIERKKAIASYYQEVKFVLTGTSMNNLNLEKCLLMFANSSQIPSLSILDFWSNYKQRFSNYGKGMLLPTKIAIMDEFAKQEMIAEGFDPDRLVITGQPAFDCLADKRAAFNEGKRYDVWRGNGVHPDKKLVVFASQPHSKQPYDYGYNEHTVLDMLIKALSDIDPMIHVIVRPHPREKIEDLLMHERADNPTVTVKRKGDVHDLLMAADLVVGMNTELLVESCYLGCITLSLQPGMKGTDRLPTNRLGVSWGVYDRIFIRPSLRGFLMNVWARDNMKAKLQNFTVKEKAAPKVAQLIYEMIGV